MTLNISLIVADLATLDALFREELIKVLLDELPVIYRHGATTEERLHQVGAVMALKSDGGYTLMLGGKPWVEVGPMSVEVNDGKMSIARSVDPWELGLEALRRMGLLKIRPNDPPQDNRGVQ